MLFVAGLILIILGWIAQIYKTWIKRERDLSPVLLVLYGVGCILLSTGSFLANDVNAGVLNALLVALAVVLLIVIQIRKKIV